MKQYNTHHCGACGKKFPCGAALAEHLKRCPVAKVFNPLLDAALDAAMPEEDDEKTQKEMEVPEV